MSPSLFEALQKYMTISEEQRASLAPHMKERRYAKGAFFLQPPSISHEIAFIISGVFRYYTINEEGEEVTSMFLKEGDFFTELASFQKVQPATGAFQAETKATVAIIHRSVHELLRKQYPEWDNAFKYIVQDHLTNQLKIYWDIVKLDATESYRYFLEHHPTIVKRVPDHHLASFLGISKYTLSRVKKKLS